jgi:hypothetical protein
MPDRVRKAAGDAFEVGKNPVTSFVVQAVESGVEEFIIIHCKDLAGEAGAALPF